MNQPRAAMSEVVPGGADVWSLTATVNVSLRTISAASWPAASAAGGKRASADSVNDGSAPPLDMTRADTTASPLVPDGDTTRTSRSDAIVRVGTRQSKDMGGSGGKVVIVVVVDVTDAVVLVVVVAVREFVNDTVEFGAGAVLVSVAVVIVDEGVAESVPVVPDVTVAVFVSVAVSVDVAVAVVVVTVVAGGTFVSDRDGVRDRDREEVNGEKSLMARSDSFVAT